MVRAAAVAVIRGVSDGFSKALARTPVPLNVARAKLQHKAYVQAMAARVSEVLQVPAAPDLADCVFIEDVAVCVGSQIVLTRPGAPSRRDEVAGLAAVLQTERFRALPGAWSLTEMEDEGATVDGGDVLVTDQHCFVGLSSRTNLAGLRCLQRLLAPQLPAGAESVLGIEVLDDLHLKSIATHAGGGQLAVHDSRGGAHFRETVDALLGASSHGYTLHMMPHEAANVVRVGPYLLVAEECGRMPEVQRLAKAAGVHVSRGTS